MKKDDALYRPGVGIVLLNRDKRVFIAQRADKQFDAWQMPQGGIDEGETEQQAAWRELGEETGTDKAELIAESACWHYYDLPFDLAQKLWGGRFRGQRQKWFAMRFLGEDKDIDIHAHTSPEFTAWRWAAPEDLLDLIVPFKRDVYKEVLREFAGVLK